MRTVAQRTTRLQVPTDPAQTINQAITTDKPSQRLPDSPQALVLHEQEVRGSCDMTACVSQNQHVKNDDHPLRESLNKWVLPRMHKHSGLCVL